MGRRVQLIRHATGAADAFVGLQGEITVDTTAKALRVHDSLSAGGIKVARADLANVPGATTSVDGKLIAADKQKLEWLGITQDVDLDTLEAEVAIALADIIAIEAKTDFITVTQAVNLDTMESDLATAEANIATLDTDLGVAETKLATIETGATADQTNAEIRTAVEAATDSNVFTDADHTKLNSVESGATGDQTNAEIKTAVGAATDSNIFSDAEQTKLAGIEAGAEVNDINAGDFHVNAYMSALYALTTSLVVLAFDTEVLDPQADFNTGTFRYVPSSAGVYCVQIKLQYTPLSANGSNIFSALYKNGLNIAADQYLDELADGTLSTGLMISTLVSMNGTTDYLDVRAKTTVALESGQVSGGALLSSFSAFKISN